jgi:GTPase SAR1 family protein
VRRGYYRGSARAFIIFDLTSHDAFDHVDQWLHGVKEVARSDVGMALIGNKCDRVNDRDMTRDEAERMAQANKMLYFETSAKAEETINE